MGGMGKEMYLRQHIGYREVSIYSYCTYCRHIYTAPTCIYEFAYSYSLVEIHINRRKRRKNMRKKENLKRKMRKCMKKDK
jgi:hypothetical protein